MFLLFLWQFYACGRFIFYSTGFRLHDKLIVTLKHTDAFENSYTQ